MCLLFKSRCCVCGEGLWIVVRVLCVANEACRSCLLMLSCKKAAHNLYPASPPSPFMCHGYVMGVSGSTWTLRDKTSARGWRHPRQLYGTTQIDVRTFALCVICGAIWDGSACSGRYNNYPEICGDCTSIVLLCKTTTSGRVVDIRRSEKSSICRQIHEREHPSRCRKRNVRHTSWSK